MSRWPAARRPARKHDFLARPEHSPTWCSGRAWAATSARQAAQPDMKNNNRPAKARIKANPNPSSPVFVPPNSPQSSTYPAATPSLPPSPSAPTPSRRERRRSISGSPLPSASRDRSSSLVPLATIRPSPSPPLRHSASFSSAAVHHGLVARWIRRCPYLVTSGGGLEADAASAAPAVLLRLSDARYGSRLPLVLHSSSATCARRRRLPSCEERAMGCPSLTHFPGPTGPPGTKRSPWARAWAAGAARG
jgi:hypothetical protein